MSDPRAVSHTTQPRWIQGWLNMLIQDSKCSILRRGLLESGHGKLSQSFLNDGFSNTLSKSLSTASVRDAS